MSIRFHLRSIRTVPSSSCAWVWPAHFACVCARAYACVRACMCVRVCLHEGVCAEFRIVARWSRNLNNGQQRSRHKFLSVRCSFCSVSLSRPPPPVLLSALPSRSVSKKPFSLLLSVDPSLYPSLCPSISIPPSNTTHYPSLCLSLCPSLSTLLSGLLHSN